MTFRGTSTRLGGVYNPDALRVPIGESSDQVTAVLEVPYTVATNCRLSDCSRSTFAGSIHTLTDGKRLIVADALLVVSVTLDAVTITVKGLSISTGAV